MCEQRAAAISNVPNGDSSEFFLHRRRHTLILSRPRGDHMKFWILACGALAALAAHAAYTFSQRQGRRRGQFDNDQVSSEWLATAKIHEDQN
jgi:hypothetical protein